MTNFVETNYNLDFVRVNLFTNLIEFKLTQTNQNMTRMFKKIRINSFSNCKTERKNSTESNQIFVHEMDHSWPQTADS